MRISEILILLTIWYQPAKVEPTTTVYKSCEVDLSNHTYSCNSNGKFNDPLDTDCTKYYLCVQYSLSYVVISLTCPDGTYFNPSIQECTSTYSCFSSQIEEVESVTTAECGAATQNSCTIEGQFADLNDNTCSKYYVCTRYGDSFVETELSCPQGSYFDRQNSICNVNYTCPCNYTSSTIVSTTKGAIITSPIDATTSSFVTSESFQTENNNLSEITIYLTELTTDSISVSKNADSSTEYLTSEATDALINSTTVLPATVTTPSVESTTESCVINYDPNYFVCSTKGRYPNLNDPTCQSYYLCNLLRNGSYLQTKYSCPDSSYFNAPLQVCDVSYTCPCQGITLTSSVGSTSLSPASSDFTTTTTENPSPETAYYTTGSTVSSTDPTSALPTTILSTTENSIEPCIINYDPQYFVCSTKGRYPNLNDPTCQTYFLCNLLRNGSYLQTKYSCPDSSYFNAELQVCDVSYICPCQGITSSTETTTSYIGASNATEITTEPAVSGTSTETTVSSSESTVNSIDSSSTLTTDVTTVATETTTEPCIINYDPKYFVCSAKGRYPNLNDLTCQTYYLCNLLRNGSYLQTSYSCPDSSYFNPPLQVCDVSYTCPCQGVTITSSAETTTSSIDISDSTEITTEPAVSSSITSTETLFSSSESTVNSIDSSSTLPTDVTTVVTETTTESCIINYDPKYFVCTAKGRYPNLNDPTCQTYYLCNLLRNGSYLQTSYSCPDSSYFNPPLQVCDVSYTCPCQGVTITSSTETATSSTGTSGYPEITSEPVVSTVTTSTETTISTTEPIVNSTDSLSTLPTDVTTVATESTTEPCVINYDPKYFICSAKGRYPNLNDPTCQTYFLCNLLRNGSYLQTSYSCPDSSYFNPPLQVCDVSYTCPCQGVTITSTEITTSSIAASNATEITTVPAVSGTSTETSVPSSESTVNSIDSSSTLPTDVTTVATETTTEPCIINYDPKYFVCSAKGRYPNLNDPTCQTYYLCNLLRNGSYLQTSYSCPDSSYFNPPLQVCDVSYTCPCQGVTITSSAETTISSNDTSDSTEITTEPAVSSSITSTETLFSSSESTVNSIDSSNTLPTDVTTVATEITTEPCIINYDPKYFVCTAKGRYPNLNDPTCQTYYLCNLLRNGSYLQTSYSCPDSSYFNPPLQVCDVSYICPCQGVTITSTETTTLSIGTSNATEITTEHAVSGTSTETSISTNASTDNSIDSSSTLSTDVTTVVTESTTEPCVINYDPKYFVCSEKGRYRNLNDPTCQTYFLCNLLKNGSYLQTSYSCPDSSYFNPPLQVCDVSYKCPCQGVAITSSTEITTSSIDTSDSTEITTEPEVTGSITSTETSVSSSASTVNSIDSSSTLSTDVTTAATKSTTEPCIINYDPKYFVCSAKGRYPNLNDPTCQTYYLCNLLRNGSYLQTSYSCPDSSYFNPRLQVCDVSYTCPCQGVTITSTETTSSTDTSDFPEITSEPVVSTVTRSTETTISTTEPIVNSTDSLSTLPTDVTTVGTESTTEPCVINYDPKYFVCSAKGRYPNLNDPTCQMYFLCNLLRNGSYLQTSYSCPDSSYFNPPLQVCDVSYTCPCQGVTITSSTETATSSIGAGNSTEITTESVGSGIITSTETLVSSSASTVNPIDPSTTLSTDVTTVVTESITEPCIINYDPKYFVCSAKGRYPNLNDPTCQTYFLCNLLRNGSYLQTSYSCPDSSYFNPPLQVCDVSYRCPCQGITITSSTETTTSSIDTDDSTEITTEPAVSDVITSTETSVDSSSTSQTDVTTVVTESTTEPCIINYDPEYFICSTKGRYPNLNDPTCQSYYLCNLLRNGSYLQTKYSCPDSSYFNPPLQVCDVSYTCPCQGTVITTTTETTIESTETTTELASTSTNYSPEITTDVGSTTEPCVINYDPDYFTCGTKGRFPNLNDPTCQSYFLCNQLRNGSYLQTKYNCPDSSYFNPPLQVCDVSYVCPCAQT